MHQRSSGKQDVLLNTLKNFPVKVSNSKYFFEKNLWKSFRSIFLRAFDNYIIVHQRSSGKQDLSSKQRGKIYQCCFRLVLLYCCETQDLTVAEEVRICGIEHHLIRMCVGRLIDRLLTDVLQDRVGAVLKTKDMIIKSRLQ